jgi:predicted DsbA family dithiol-disulfide isomerase
MSDKAISVDVVSDVVCPWCFVGKRNLASALAQWDGGDVEVRWRPYQLDPTIPPGGMDRAEYMARKFGPDRAKNAHERLTQIGQAAGLDFAFDAIKRSPNTLDAHRLIRWAAETDKQAALVERLFNLYFVEGQDIGDRDVLAKAASELGLDAQEIRARLETDADVKTVQDEIASAARMGVSGVPFFIIDGKYGLSGAQPPEAILSALRKVAEERAGA